MKRVKIMTTSLADNVMLLVRDLEVILVIERFVAIVGSFYATGIASFSSPVFDSCECR